MPPEFVQFGKIPRLFREVVITEKIDGTNAVVYVADDGAVWAGSRTRWITPDNDNFGFARWVVEHEEELRVGLGFGTHHGEWWGQGIQRRYDLGHKRFSLFNVTKWGDPAVRPTCCFVVPVLYRGVFSTGAVQRQLDLLRSVGSVAAPGFMRPEGVVVYHASGNCLFKATIEDDESPKGMSS